MGKPFVKLTWSDVLGLSLTLAEEIRRERVEAIIAVLRGGIYPALAIAARLNIDRIYTVELRKYSDDKPPKEVRAEPELIRENVPELQSRRVLVVDDVARTGATLRVAKKLALSKGASEVKTAVLVIRSKEMFEAPDYYAIFMNSCPLFPWEHGEG